MTTTETPIITPEMAQRKASGYFWTHRNMIAERYGSDGWAVVTYDTEGTDSSVAVDHFSSVAEADAMVEACGRMGAAFKIERQPVRVRGAIQLV